MADRRLSGVIAAVTVLLVCAVLWDAMSRPLHRSRHAVAPAMDTAPARPVPASPPALPQTTGVSASAPAEPPPQPSYIEQLARAEARRRIRASAGYAYLDQIVGESRDSALHRWDDRMSRPVRVYLPGGTAANFQPAFLDAVQRAFEEWADAGVPVRFDVGADSERAEVRFQWKVQFDIDRTGQTDLVWDQEGRILSGVVTIATFDPKGTPLSADDIRVVALHEIGHVLGLDHSSDSTDIMYAKTQARQLSARDIHTALMLYQFPPGPVR